MSCEYGFIFSTSILGVNDFYRDLWGCGIYFSWSAHPCNNRQSFQTSGQFITFTKYHSPFLGWSCVNGSIYTLSWLLFWYLKRCWILKNHSLSVKSHLLEFTLAEWSTNFSLVLEHMILFRRSRVRLRITIMMVPSKRLLAAHWYHQIFYVVWFSFPMDKLWSVFVEVLRQQMMKLRNFLCHCWIFSFEGSIHYNLIFYILGILSPKLKKKIHSTYM